MATVEQTLLWRSPVIITVDGDGDWHNKRKEFELVSPELNVTSYDATRVLVEDRWTYGCGPLAGEVVIDVGAGIGDDAVIFSQLVGPGGRVVAIEAHPVTFRCLTKTVKANGLTNIISLNLAVADTEGEVTISEQANFLSNSVVDGQFGARVRARRLDDICSDLNITSPRLIKMNIEGAETKAVVGAARLMPDARFVVSCHNFKSERGDGQFFSTASDVRKNLIDSGYMVEQRFDDPRREVYWIVYAGA